MHSIYRLNSKNMQEISVIAQLHVRAFPNFFLTQLGESFLRLLYKGYIEDDDSGIIVAEIDGSIIGFIAYSFDYSKFFKFLLSKHFLKFSLYAFFASVRHPSFIKRLFGALKKSDNVTKEEKYVELASICVDPNNEGLGIGSELISYLIEIVDFETYEYINLETDAVQNDSVNMFYLKNGFSLERQFVTPEGRIMNEYRYKPDKCL